MNMFKPVKAQSIKQYFDMLSEDRLEPMKFLDKFIRKVAPSLKPSFPYNMPGYGSFKYLNYKKEVVDWPIIALASQKNYISIYICAVKNGEYLAEKYKRDLGKVSVGRSCIRFRKLDDINLKTLDKVIKLAAKSPGLIGAGEKN